MRATLLSILLLVLACSGRAQTIVIFQLNLDPLVEEQLFSPDEGHRVFVRGGFNNWQGTSYELTRVPGKNLYTGSFALEGEAGDTLEYKFVIEKESGRFFWESRPDPSNTGYGNRRLVLNVDTLLLGEALFNYDEYFTFPVIFSKEKLQADFLQMRKILEETHPALYDYTGKEVMDSLFDSHYAAIDGDMDFNSFLILMTEVISQVGCGHSSLWLPGDYWNVAPYRLFPLRLEPVGDKLYVSGSYGDSGEATGMPVPSGSVILSINGEPIESIVTRLESLTSADGMNQAYRRANVGQQFAVKYALAYGFPENFRIEHIPPGEQLTEQTVLQPVSKASVDAGITAHNELSMRELEQGNTALLTINTFSYYNQVDMFKTFVDSVFSVIDQKGIQHLIIDLRGNSGGDPFCSSYLWGYLQHEPVPYFEDHYGRYDTLANVIPQPEKHFNGELYTLIDGLGFSTTGHFCGLLKYHRVGKFVGSETGATYTCTGNATYPALDNTRIMVGTARVMRYTAAVKDMDPLRGIIPDYSVEPSQDDLVTGRDAVLDYALSLIQEH